MQILRSAMKRSLVVLLKLRILQMHPLKEEIFLFFVCVSDFIGQVS